MRIKRNAAVAVIVALCVSTLAGQGGGGIQGGGGLQGGRGRAGGAPPANLPEAPTAVALPTISAEITGPGPMFDSAPSLAPGKGLAAFGYQAREYFVSGTVDGEPYTTRIVVRKPADNSKFSGLVLAEAMHGSGAAHMFEFTPIYGMTSGHAAVENPDHTAGAVRCAQRGALSRPQTQWRADQRDPRAGRLARPQRQPGWRSGPKDGAGRDVDDSRCADQLPACTHGLPDAADAAHLRLASCRCRTARWSATSMCR